MKTLPKIELSQETIDKLEKLHDEMLNINRLDKAFDQDDCQVCVIGNGIRARVLGEEFRVYGEDEIIGFPRNHPAKAGGVHFGDFSKAVESLGITGPNHRHVTNYMFESVLQVMDSAVRLEMPRPKEFSAFSAAERIRNVIERAGVRAEHDYEKIADEVPLEVNDYYAAHCYIKACIYGDRMYYGDDETVQAMNDGQVVLLDRADVCRGLWEWTIADAQCREIVRTRFRIDTWFVDGVAKAECWNTGDIADGESIADAEITCLLRVHASGGLEWAGRDE